MSPTIDRIGPYRIFFFSNEGTDPAHEHVPEGRKLAKVWLNPVRLGYSRGFADHELNRVLGIIEENEGRYREEWNAFFSG